jgi:hypothetical protein
MKKTRTIITSARVKKLVAEAVEKALVECARQHKAHSEPYTGAGGTLMQPTEEMLNFGNTQPDRLKLSFEFQWDNPKDSNKPTRMVCQPVIELSGKK